MPFWTNVRRRIQCTVKACLKNDKSEKIHEGCEKQVKNKIAVSTDKGNSLPESSGSVWTRIQQQVKRTFSRFRRSQKQHQARSSEQSPSPCWNSCVPDVAIVSQRNQDAKLSGETCVRVRGNLNLKTKSLPKEDLYCARSHNRVSTVKPHDVPMSDFGPTTEIYIDKLRRPVGRTRRSKKPQQEKSSEQHPSPCRNSCVLDVAIVPQRNQDAELSGETCARIRGNVTVKTKSLPKEDLFRVRSHKRVSGVKSHDVRTGFGPTTEIFIDQLGRPAARLNVEGDGNCFFRCVSVWLTGSEDMHLSLRLILYKVMSVVRTKACKVGQ